MSEPIIHLTKKDFELQFYRGTGNGGQKINKTEMCCRIYHRPSGCVATSEEERYQMQNRKIAFERLVSQPKFRVWLYRQHFVKLGQQKSDEQIEREIEQQMSFENIKIEIKKDGKWTEVDLHDFVFSDD